MKISASHSGFGAEFWNSTFSNSTTWSPNSGKISTTQEPVMESLDDDDAFYDDYDDEDYYDADLQKDESTW